MKKRALVSVSDKSGLAELVCGLHDLGYELLSTGGGTAAAITKAGVPFRLVEEVTGYPEMLDGRVKTLHPAIHGGLLAKRDSAEHMEQLTAQNLGLIDLVVVNFYPFEQVMGADWETLIENIDIGGPSMVRSAAKNHRDVLVLVDPADYPEVLSQLQGPGVSSAVRRQLAVKALSRTAYYDAMISGHLAQQVDDGEDGDFFTEGALPLRRQQILRYGENPHQQAALYRLPASDSSLVDGQLLHGKPLSYNNIQDADAALRLARRLPLPAVVAIKHANPCGVGCGADLLQCWQKAYQSDPVSIFGGIVACNVPVCEAVAQEMDKIFLEVVLAPSFEPRALEVLLRKKNLRLLQVNFAARTGADKFVSVDGGMLWWKDRTTEPPAWRRATGEEVSAACLDDLRLAWQVVSQVKSNAIVLVRDGGTVGIGAGQMNRVGAARIAIEQAGEKVRGAVLASDAFFPFPDTVVAATAAGVRAIVQPGGSVRDRDSEEVCRQHATTMYYTGRREFVH